MLAGCKALILFADGCKHTPVRAQTVANDTAGEGGERKPAGEDEEEGGTKKRKQDRIPSLDRVAGQGVSGWLSIRRHMSCGSKPGVALCQLLGVMPDCIAAANGNMAELGGFDIDSSKGQKKANLNERYGGLDIRILSNQTASLELSRSLEAKCERLACGEEFLGAKEDQTEQAAKAMAAQVQSHFDSSAEMVLVHLDASESEDQRATQRCLQALDLVAKEVWGDGQQDFLQGVVLGGAGGLGEGVLGHVRSGEGEEKEAGGDAAQRKGKEEGGQEEEQAWVEYLRPLQSTHVHNGKVLSEAEHGKEQRLYYTLYHPSATRNDRVSSLAPEDILYHGGNGGSLSQHWLMEMAFLLGKMPKYGA